MKDSTARQSDNQDLGQVEALLAQNRALSRQKDELEAVLAGVQGSLSWKITRPVRWLGALQVF